MQNIYHQSEMAGGIFIVSIEGVAGVEHIEYMEAQKSLQRAEKQLYHVKIRNNIDIRNNT